MNDVVRLFSQLYCICALDPAGKLLVQWKLNPHDGEYEKDILLLGLFIDLSNGGVVQLVVVSVSAILRMALQIVRRQYTQKLLKKVMGQMHYAFTW